MSKLYLVTGGAGFIGSSLVRRLLHDGHRVRVLDNLSRGNAGRLADISDRVEFIEAEVRDAGAAVFIEGVELLAPSAYERIDEFKRLAAERGYPTLR